MQCAGLGFELVDVWCHVNLGGLVSPSFEACCTWVREPIFTKEFAFSKQVKRCSVLVWEKCCLNRRLFLANPDGMKAVKLFVFRGG